MCIKERKKENRGEGGRGREGGEGRPAERERLLEKNDQNEQVTCNSSAVH